MRAVGGRRISGGSLGVAPLEDQCRGQQHAVPCGPRGIPIRDRNEGAGSDLDLFVVWRREALIYASTSFTKATSCFPTSSRVSRLGS